MNTVTGINRRVISITFNQAFESLLLNYPSHHQSLTHDLELAANHGLELLEELEDVHDLQHVDYVRGLVAKTNQLSVMDGLYFSSWKLAVAADLLDEIDLLLLTHGSDLHELGLRSTSRTSLLVLLSIAGCQAIIS